MNYQIYLFTCLIILFNTVKGIKMNKEEVLNLNLEKFSNATQCPEFGYKYTNEQYKYYPCYFTFYCINDNNCQSYNNTSPFFEFIDEKGQVKKYIQKSCGKEESDCKTEKCESNTDCLSNNCYNNTCVPGNSLFTECSDVYYRDYSSEHDKVNQVMKCGKIENEECKRKSDCSGTCTTSYDLGDGSNSYSFCSSHVLIHEEIEIGGLSIMLASVIIITLICFIACCCCICCCICKNRSEK